jgi:hypothetical protein
VAELIVGALAATSLFLIIGYAQRHGLRVSWWQWCLTALAILYSVFVVEMVIGFLREGNPKAAIVRGAVLGFVAVVWGALLARFVFRGGAGRAPRGPRSTAALRITDEKRADHG